MRPFVLLLIVVPAILHAYPQRQSDRKLPDVVEAGVTSRGSRKFNSRDVPLLEDQGAWRPERTERRQPSRQLPQEKDHSSVSSKGPTADSRRRSDNRRAHKHVPEPDTASSVVTSVAQQLVTSRRTFKEPGSPPEEITLQSDSRRRRLGITPNSRHTPVDKNVGQNGNRTQTNSHNSDDASTEFSRRFRNGRRQSAPSTETPKSSGRRGTSTGVRKQQNSLLSVTTLATVQRSTSVQSVKSETSSSSPLTEVSSTIKVPDETEIPLEPSNTTIGVEVRQELPVIDVPELEGIKTGELLEIRRKEASGRSGRKINSSQTSVSRKRNRDSNTILDSVSFPSTQKPHRRPSGYTDTIKKVPNSTLTSSHDHPAEIPQRGFTRRTSTTDFLPKDGERRPTSMSIRSKNVAEVDTSVNGPRSRGQPRNRARESAERERSVEARQQRTHNRNSTKSGGSRAGLSDDAALSSKPPITARNLGDQTLSRNRDVTHSALNSRKGNRRSPFRGDEFKVHKSVSSLESSENAPQSRSSAEEEVKKLQKHERDSEEQEAHADLEDSFITRSSHRVVTVTAYPYNENQKPPTVGSSTSKGRTRTPDKSMVNSKMSNGTTDVSKIRPRIANLLLAPTPPSNKAGNNAQHRQMQVVGGYNRLRSSRFSNTQSDDSGNSEGHSVVTTVPPLTRYGSRKCSVDSDENKISKLPSTVPRGRSCDEKYQKEVPAAEMHQQVPTSSAVVSDPNPAVSHAVRKPLGSQVTTSNTGIGGTTQKKPALRSTSSFRRSVELAMGDNWIVPTSNSVPVVTSQSALSSIPRFSSRYRNELLRATGHGLRGTTAPAYVPTVPTVSTTSTNVQTMFSDTSPVAPNLLDAIESRTPSRWKHTMTSQSTSHTLSPKNTSTHTSSSHNATQSLETKTSVRSLQSSVLSVSVKHSITDGSTMKHSDSSSKSPTQESNPTDNSTHTLSLDRWNVQTDLKSSMRNSALSTKTYPNRDISTAKDIIRNTETRDSNGVFIKPRTISKPKQNLLSNSSKITVKETQSIPKKIVPVTIPSNFEISFTTISNQSAATKFNLQPHKTISSASVTSVLTNKNPQSTQKYSDFTTDMALIVDLKPKTTIQSQKINRENSLLLPNFHDIIILSTTKSPLTKTIKTLTSDAENSPMQFAVKLTAPPKGTVGSTTSRVVRVRDVKSSLGPTETTVSTVTDRIIPKNRAQARATTEVPISFTTTDLPPATTDINVNNILIPDLPTTTFETLNLQTTTLSTTDAPSMTEQRFDLPTTTERPTFPPRTTIPSTTTVPTISTIPATTYFPAVTIPTTNIPATTSFSAVTIPTTIIPATTTIPTTETLTTIPSTEALTTIPTTEALTNIPTTTIIPVTQTMPISMTTPVTTASPSTTQITTVNIIASHDVENNVQPLSVTQTTTTAAPRVFTTTLRTPVPYVIFGIYPNGTVFRKLPNSDFKEQVHENEIARRNPFYPDQRYFSTTPSAPAQSVNSNEFALQAPSFDDGFNDARNQIQDEVAQVPQLPAVLSTIPQPPAPTEAPAKTSGFALGNLISNALGIDPQSGSLPSARAKFLGEIVRNSNIITASTTTTMSTTTTTTAKMSATPSPMPPLPSSTAAAPKTTANPAAGVLDDFSFLNVLLLGRPPDTSPRPGRNQGSSIANRIIQVALERGNSSRKKPSATTPKVTTTKMTTSSTTTQKPTTSKATTPKTTTSAPQQPSVEQNQEDLAALLKLLENMESTTPGNLTPSQQLLADFLIKQATAQPSERNLNNQISIQNVLSPPAISKTSKKLKSSPTAEAAPGQLLGELFGPLVGGNQGDTKIRDPRAGQGLVEAAIKATKTVSQLMGSVLQGATKSLQSFMKSLAWGSGAGSG